jgi:hypothetical protein
LGYNAYHAGLEAKEHRAGHKIAAKGLVVKYADAVEVRSVLAAVLAAVADAVLVSHHLPKYGAHLPTSLV